MDEKAAMTDDLNVVRRSKMEEESKKIAELKTVVALSCGSANQGRSSVSGCEDR